MIQRIVKEFMTHFYLKFALGVENAFNAKVYKIRKITAYF